MLPGIRFLCAAVALAVSLVIFGMGAAALLRSAHEEFASLPNHRPPPVPDFGRQPDPPPSLAMLRLEPRVTEVSDPTLSPAIQSGESTPSAATTEAKTDSAPEPIATAIVAPAVEAEKPVSIEASPATPSEPAMVVAAAPAQTSEPAPAPLQTAPVPETTASISLPTATIMELPTATLTAEDAQLSSSKVAVLGGPTIHTEPVPLPSSRPTAEPPKAKPVKKVMKKPAIRKRRVAARAMPAVAPVAQQQDPFGLSQLR